jgi:hypothetical protein
LNSNAKIICKRGEFIHNTRYCDLLKRAIVSSSALQMKGRTFLLRAVLLEDTLKPYAGMSIDVCLLLDLTDGFNVSKNFGPTENREGGS